MDPVLEQRDQIVEFLIVDQKVVRRAHLKYQPGFSVYLVMADWKKVTAK